MSGDRRNFSDAIEASEVTVRHARIREHVK